MTIHLSSDFERWQEFRQLVVRAGGEAVATYLWLRLYVELGGLVQTTQRLGFFPEEAEELFRASLGEHADKFPLLTSEGSSFPLLKPVEGGEGWECALFIRDNEHLKPGAKSIQARGGHFRAFEMAQRKTVETVGAQTLLLPDELFKRPDGESMTPEECRRVTLIVRTADNALKLAHRLPGGFTRGLIEDAWRVHETMTDEQIMAVARTVVAHRDHPAMPKTTEKLLPVFREIMRRVG